MIAAAVLAAIEVPNVCLASNCCSLEAPVRVGSQSLTAVFRPSPISAFPFYLPLPFPLTPPRSFCRLSRIPQSPVSLSKIPVFCFASKISVVLSRLVSDNLPLSYPLHSQLSHHSFTRSPSPSLRGLPPSLVSPLPSNFWPFLAATRTL